MWARSALVTGAARGIGLETARALHRRGVRVALVDLDAAEATRAAASVGATGTLGLRADVTDRADIGAAVDAAVERFGGLDVVVANAGVAPPLATTLAMGEDAFEHVLAVNLLGVSRTVHAALPHVVRQRGQVGFVASIYSFMNGAGAAPYAASKAGVEAFARALRSELAQHGAGTTTAYFGFVGTEMYRQGIVLDPIGDRLLGALPAPLRKRVTPEAAGEAVARALERRAPRIVRPRRWLALSVLRGALGPLLDRRTLGDAKVQGLLAELDVRERLQPPPALDERERIGG